MFKKQENRELALIIILSFIAVLILVCLCDIRNTQKELTTLKEEIVVLQTAISENKPEDNNIADNTTTETTTATEVTTTDPEEVVEGIDDDEDVSPIDEDESIEVFENEDEDEDEPVDIDAPMIAEIKYHTITCNTDIGVDTAPTVQELDMLIDYWDKRVYDGQGTPFKGYGWAFRRAYECTGIDPIVIFSIAAWEGGWGKSAIARDKFNFYGIGAFDGSAYESAAVMGDNIGDGIINGAIWIYENYYSRGKTTLNKIAEGGYCTTGVWDSTLVDQMINPCYRILDDLKNGRITI